MAGGNFISSAICHLKRSRGVIIHEIWPELTLFTAVAVMVYGISEVTGIQLAFQGSLSFVLGTVLGLMVSFRITSAYDRYWEGRELWATISLSSRGLADIIWIHVPTNRLANSETALDKDAQLRVLIEKKSMINLVQAFSASLKHSLRGETGVYYEDVYPLLAFLPKYSSGANAGEPMSLWSDYSSGGGHALGNNGQSNKNSDGPFEEKEGFDRSHLEGMPPTVPLKNAYLAPACDLPKSWSFEFSPAFMPFQALYSFFKRIVSKLDEADRYEKSWIGNEIHCPAVASDVALEIILHLSSYFNFLMQEGLLQPAAATSFNDNLDSLQGASFQLRRVATIPVPFAYRAHLRVAIWLYLLFLIFQLYNLLNWVSIPATTLAASLYLGVFELGAETKNLFSNDENGQSVDSYCLSIQREIAEITAHNPLPPGSYVFSPANRPFAPADRKTAYDLMMDTESEYLNEENGMDTLRSTLVKRWRDVSEMTADTEFRVSA